MLPASALYFLFFLSGASGLIYQVVWVRVFGNVFGNTIYSASIVTSVFMLGLGAGSYAAGAWADRRFLTRPLSLVRTYGHFELLIGILGLSVSLLLPHLGRLSASVSRYTGDAAGWHVLSMTSYAARGAIAVILLAPITLLMGGTLTLLIRYLVRREVDTAGRHIAVLYAINTAGAAAGCLATDFVLVPAVGLQGAQGVAAAFNVVAAAGALALSSRARSEAGPPLVDPAVVDRPEASAEPVDSAACSWAALALGLSGFAAMGMEIVWFRHFTLLLGVFRAVYSLLLAVILIGIGAGALAAGLLRRHADESARWLIALQGLFVVSVLYGIERTDIRDITATAQALEQAFAVRSTWAQGVAEVWFNLRAILLEVGLPATLLGFAFPLANAIVQRRAPSVGRRAGLLYLANTIGAVCGALAAGFALLPRVGIQRSVTILAVIAWTSAVPLAFSTSGHRRRSLPVLAASTAIGGFALVLWLALPSDQVIRRAVLLPAGNELVVLQEDIGEVAAVSDDAGGRRWLITNGHPMSSTGRFDQRYMRALAHIPLLLAESPERVLVIGFGVGNTTHAATLHPRVRRVEVAELSRRILDDAIYFKEVNRDVLTDPRVSVFVNDGRQHLQIQPPASYDVITLEPPPIAHAGVGALYSAEFYALVRSRLKPRGYVSQWLPAYQVPASTTLSMIRAFVEAFPHAVLLSGAQPNLQLLGADDAGVEIDPARLAAALRAAPAVARDLERLDLGSIREIAGMFLGSERTLQEATSGYAPVTDDRPLQEYSVRSLLNFSSAGAPSSIVDLGRIADWCPRCFDKGAPVGAVAGLDTYLALLARAYLVPLAGTTLNFDDPKTRQMARSSAYLDSVLHGAALVHNDLGLSLVSDGRLDEAIGEFEEALSLQPELASARRNLAAAHRVRGRSSDGPRER
jgi:spermidine synthase